MVRVFGLPELSGTLAIAGHKFSTSKDGESALTPGPSATGKGERVTAQRVEQVVENCPDCDAHLTGGWVQRTREVIELPQVPVQVAVQVTEHVYLARTCPRCRRRCLPPAQQDGVALGQQRLGVNLVSLIAALAGGGSVAHPQHPVIPASGTCQWYLDTGPGCASV